MAHAVIGDAIVTHFGMSREVFAIKLLKEKKKFQKKKKISKLFEKKNFEKKIKKQYFFNYILLIIIHIKLILIFIINDLIIIKIK